MQQGGCDGANHEGDPVNGASGQGSIPASIATPVTAAQVGSFTAATRVRPLGDGTFTADLSGDCTVGHRPHGGYVLSLLARAALQVGTAAVVAANLEQRGRSCVESVVTVGRMAEDSAVWTDLPDLPAKPPADALDLAAVPG